jgi:HEAT repeat protein
MLPVILTTLGLMLSSAAWAGVEPDEFAQLQEMGSDYVQARDALVADSSLSDADLEDLSTHADWRVRLSAASVLGWRAHPQRYREASRLAPIRTRAGFFRFPASDMLHDVAYMPAFAERLLHTETDPGIRGALAELIGRTQGDWSPTVSAALEQETDPHAKGMMLATVRHGDRALAEAAFTRASTDMDSAVRQEVAQQCSWMEGSAVAIELIGSLLEDEDAGVRGQAARSAGVLELDQFGPRLGALIDDEDPEVRLHALRAVHRAGLNAAKFANARLQDDDEKVRRAAARILAE